MPFVDIKKRDEFIVNHFKNIFGMPFVSNSNLSEFFGDKADHPIINSHKLSNCDRDTLELPLHINELDQSLESANINSAPGADGFPMLAIKNSGLCSENPCFGLSNSWNKRVNFMVS